MLPKWEASWCQYFSAARNIKKEDNLCRGMVNRRRTNSKGIRKRIGRHLCEEREVHVSTILPLASLRKSYRYLGPLSSGRSLAHYHAEFLHTKLQFSLDPKWKEKGKRGLLFFFFFFVFWPLALVRLTSLGSD